MNRKPCPASDLGSLRVKKASRSGSRPKRNEASRFLFQDSVPSVFSGVLYSVTIINVVVVVHHRTYLPPEPGHDSQQPRRAPEQSKHSGAGRREDNPSLSLYSSDEFDSVEAIDSVG